MAAGFPAAVATLPDQALFRRAQPQRMAMAPAMERGRVRTA